MSVFSCAKREFFSSNPHLRRILVVPLTPISINLLYTQHTYTHTPRIRVRTKYYNVLLVCIYVHVVTHTPARFGIALPVFFFFCFSPSAAFDYCVIARRFSTVVNVRRRSVMDSPCSSSDACARAGRLMIATRTGNGRLSDKQSVSAPRLIAHRALYNVTKNQILLRRVFIIII